MFKFVKCSDFKNNIIQKKFKSKNCSILKNVQILKSSQVLKKLFKRKKCLNMKNVHILKIFKS
jgi:hypothetical protein